MIKTPGEYNLTNAEYHADPAVSSSQLVHACRSMAHFRANSPSSVDYEPPEETDAMRMGTIMHGFLLEPDTFDERFYVLPEDAPRRPTMAQRNAAKPSESTLIAVDFWNGLEHRIETEGIKLVKAEEKKIAVAMAKALEELDVDFGNDKRIKLKALFTVGEAEKSFFFQDKGTSLMCRVRPDWLIITPNVQLIIDYKTTRDAQKRPFSNQAAALLYWMRGAMYIDGVEAARKVKCDYLLLAQEKEKPCLASAYHYGTEHIEWGRELYQARLREILECIKAAKWPGYNNKLQQIEVPQWVVDQFPELAEIVYGTAN